jgi:hypothetical protein
MRELQLIANQLKNADTTLLRKDVSLHETTLTKEGTVLLKSAEQIAKREKKGSAIMLCILKP